MFEPVLLRSFVTVAESGGFTNAARQLNSTQSTVSARIAYTLTPGKPAGTPNQDIRYRMVLFMNVNNLTNRANFSGFSGTMTSPFFMKPRSVSNPRRIDFGANVNF